MLIHTPGDIHKAQVHQHWQCDLRLGGEESGTFFFKMLLLLIVKEIRQLQQNDVITILSHILRDTHNVPRAL